MDSHQLFPEFSTSNTRRGDMDPSMPPPHSLVPVVSLPVAQPAATVTGAIQDLAPRPPSPPRPRACVVCLEPADGDRELVKACARCKSDYCRDCLMEMFSAAVTNPTRMPPSCCALIQLYTVPEFLATNEADAYRSKFEEWLTRDKVYCPSPRCSAFISSRLIPQSSSTGTSSGATASPTAYQDVLLGLVTKICDSTHARFFRGEVNMKQLPNYHNIVVDHIDLRLIRSQAENGQYETLDGLSRDLPLLVNKARLYNGPGHPVTRAAENLQSFYVLQLSLAVESILQKQSGKDFREAHAKSATIFLCPSCHIAICTKCKQVEHGAEACDSSSNDGVLTMLKTFGYKKCPSCGHGVRRMFGCPHMQCLCNAHWCWFCNKALDECGGDCGEGYSDEEIDDEDVIEGNDNDEDGDSERGEPQPRVQARATNAEALPVNLDGGGARRWADTDLDFGEEPEDFGVTQAWACHHAWRPFQLPTDEFDHGDFNFLECNHCFKHLERPPVPQDSQGKKKRRWGKLQKRHDSGIEAWACDNCRLIVCVGCTGTLQSADIVQ